MKMIFDEVDENTSMSRYTVLIIDDEPNILQSLKRLFRHEPYKLVCGASGREGLELLTKLADVAVILSDQRMPEMSGSDFLAKSRKLAPDAIRMLLTGYSDMEATVAAINEGGATRYISKPWEDAELLQIVRDAVKQYHLEKENHLRKDNNEALTKALHTLIEQNEELESLAMTDPLTGLTNRRRLFEYLENELHRIKRYGGALSLIMFDIDHFKNVNDTFGHAAGDSVLVEISRQIKQVLRNADIAVRYGGEEFVILLPETELPGAVLIAERLLHHIAETSAPQKTGSPISVTVSIGVARVAPDESGADLLCRADQAMYRAKNNGRNRVEVSE